MATYFIEEYENTTTTKTKQARDLHLSGTAVTAVVAGRSVSVLLLSHFMSSQSPIVTFQCYWRNRPPHTDDCVSLLPKTPPVRPTRQIRLTRATSDTTRAVLIGIWWFLSKYPEHAKKVQAEVDGIDVNDASALATLPHLNGVINEALRLVPPVMTGGSRITGPNG